LHKRAVTSFSFSPTAPSLPCDPFIKIEITAVAL